MDGWTDLARRIRERIMALAARGVHAREDAGGVRGLRLREDERDPGPGRLDRRGSGDGAEPQGLVPAALQAARASTTSTCRPSTSRAPTSSTPTARASSASPRTGWSSPGVEYEVDCIIYASGFEVGTAFTRRAGYDMTGRDGVKLSEALGRRDAHQARHPRARLPQRLRRADLPGRQPGLQRAPQLHRGGQDDRHDRPARPRQRLPRGRGHAGGPGRLDGPAALRSRASA